MSLQKPLLTLFILTIITSSVSSTTCGSNPLLTSFGIIPDFAEAQVAPGLKYCKSLQNKASCCSATTINKFQANVDSLLTRLRESAIKRDESLIAIRDTLIPSLNTDLQDMFQAAKQAFLTVMAADPATVGAQVTTLIQAYANMASGFTNPASIEILKDNFTSYQQSRATCIIDIVKIQAAAWCLACDPDFGSKGVSQDGIDFSDTLVATLTDSCSNFINRANILSTYFSFYQISSSLVGITASLTLIAGGDLTGADLKSYASATPAVPQDMFYRSTSFPQSCSMVSCEWIETDLFKKGKVDEDALALGGVIPASSRRMLREGELVRALTVGTWSPDFDEAGVTVTFANDPSSSGSGGGNNGKGSVLQKGVTGGLVLLLSAILIFS